MTNHSNTYQAEFYKGRAGRLTHEFVDAPNPWAAAAEISRNHHGPRGAPPGSTIEVRARNSAEREWHGYEWSAQYVARFASDQPRESPDPCDKHAFNAIEVTDLQGIDC